MTQDERDENETFTEVFLVEDSPGDIRLTRDALAETNPRANVSVATDGAEALAFLRHEGEFADSPEPDLILLDLYLPKMDGRQVLAEIKQDERLRSIPTIILTTSAAEADIVKSYQLQANAYLSKPVQVDAFESLIKSISDFWLDKVKLPRRGKRI